MIFAVSASGARTRLSTVSSANGTTRADFTPPHPMSQPPAQTCACLPGFLVKRGHCPGCRGQGTRERSGCTPAAEEGPWIHSARWSTWRVRSHNQRCPSSGELPAPDISVYPWRPPGIPCPNGPRQITTAPLGPGFPDLLCSSDSIDWKKETSSKAVNASFRPLTSR